MNELKFGTVSMVSDSALYSVPVGGITSGDTVRLQLLLRPWNTKINILGLPSYFFSVLAL